MNQESRQLSIVIQSPALTITWRPLPYPMSMTVRISGEKFGKRVTLNERPLAEYSVEERQAMIDTSVGVSIFLKDETRADEAKSLIAEFFGHFQGKVESKATKYGWVVTQSALPARDDSDAFADLRQAMAS